MADTIQKMELDARDLATNIDVVVKVTNTRIFGFGVLFIRIGCWIAGLKYKDITAESAYFED